MHVVASKSRTTVVTANGEVLTKEEATVHVREIGFIRDSDASGRYTGSSLTGRLCEDHGFYNHWTCGPKPHLVKNERKIDCITANYVPFVDPSPSTSSSSSSSPTSPTSYSQETVTPTEHPASTRSESRSEEVRGNSSHRPAETENPNTNGDNEEVRGNSSHDLRDLVDECAPEHRETLPVLLLNVTFRSASKSGTE